MSVVLSLCQFLVASRELLLDGFFPKVRFRLWSRRGLVCNNAALTILYLIPSATLHSFPDKFPEPAVANLNLVAISGKSQSPSRHVDQDNETMAVRFGRGTLSPAVTLVPLGQLKCTIWNVMSLHYGNLLGRTGQSRPIVTPYFYIKTFLSGN